MASKSQMQVWHAFSAPRPFSWTEQVTAVAHVQVRFTPDTQDTQKRLRFHQNQRKITSGQGKTKKHHGISTGVKRAFCQKPKPERLLSCIDTQKIEVQPAEGIPCSWRWNDNSDLNVSASEIPGHHYPYGRLLWLVVVRNPGQQGLPRMRWQGRQILAGPVPNLGPSCGPRRRNAFRRGHTISREVLHFHVLGQHRQVGILFPFPFLPDTKRMDSPGPTQWLQNTPALSSFAHCLPTAEDQRRPVFWWQ